MPERADVRGADLSVDQPDVTGEPTDVASPDEASTDEASTDEASTDEASTDEAPLDEEVVEADEILVAARALARAALLEVTPESTVGPDAGHLVESAHVLTHRFSSRVDGYVGWFWVVTIARVDDEAPTVLEISMMPGDGALTAPDWVPWSDRLADYRASQEAAEAAAADTDGLEDVDEEDDIDDESDLEEDDLDIDDVVPEDDDDTDDDDTDDDDDDDDEDDDDEDADEELAR